MGRFEAFSSFLFSSLFLKKSKAKVIFNIWNFSSKKYTNKQTRKLNFYLETEYENRRKKGENEIFTRVNWERYFVKVENKRVLCILKYTRNMTIIVVDHIFMDRKYLGRKGSFYLGENEKKNTKNPKKKKRNSNKNV